MEKCRIGILVKRLLPELYLEENAARRDKSVKRFCEHSLEPFVYHHFGDDVGSDAMYLLDDIRFRYVHVDRPKLKAMIAKQHDEVSSVAQFDFLETRHFDRLERLGNEGDLTRATICRCCSLAAPARTTCFSALRIGCLFDLVDRCV